MEITLNVGNLVVVKTLATTLQKSTYFNSLLTNWNPEQKDHFFVDEDVIIFNHILNCLRYPNYYSTLSDELKTILDDRLDFYGIEIKTTPIQVEQITAHENKIELIIGPNTKLSGISTYYTSYYYMINYNDMTFQHFCDNENCHSKEVSKLSLFSMTEDGNYREKNVYHNALTLKSEYINLFSCSGKYTIIHRDECALIYIKYYGDKLVCNKLQ
jgi:hypothetical protein